MTQLIIAFVALFACFTPPAGASVIVNSQLNGNLLDDYSAAGSLEIDTAFFGASPIVLTVRPDAAVLTFNDLVTFLLPHAAPGYSLDLGGGATWALVGSVDPINATSFSVTSTATNVALGFAPPELLEVDLGDVGFGGTNWRIDTSRVVGTFTLTLQAVPEPASLLLVASGLLVAAATRGRRRTSR